MSYLKTIQALAALIALTGAFAAPALAEESVPTVVVTATPLQAETSSILCEGATADDARRLAKDAQTKGAHRRAAECYRAAGDHLRADKAQMRASAETSAETRQKAAVTASIARDQMKRLRAALR